MSDFWNYIKQAATDGQVSDFHLRPEKPLLFTTHHQTQVAEGIVVPCATFEEIVKALPARKNDLLDVDGAYRREGLRFRVNYFSSERQPKMTLRILPSEIPSPASIRIPDSLMNQVLQLNQGIVLVCGPTGCGKSTTLASLLSEIMKSKQWHLLTLEDPIEFPLSEHPAFGHRVTSREVGSDIVDFAQGLRSGLRQAPKAILVGEIRDRETAENAIQASLTGHLVLSTLHTNNAPLTVARLLNLFPHDMSPMIASMLPDVLKIIICQRLESSIDGKSRVALHEVMQMTTPVAQHIRNQKFADIASEIETGRNYGHQSFKLAYDLAYQARLIAKKSIL